MSGPIRSILIVGGGTAGWMAATFLGRMLRRQRTAITLVESPDIGTIGVGEATIPSMVRFVRMIGLDEADFMRRCAGTYKDAIRFTDWIEDGHTYWHPFGITGTRIAGQDLFHYWLKRRMADGDKSNYADHSLQKILSERHLAPRPIEGTSRIIENGTYAYHIDAGALALYLREVATSEGVKHLFGEVSHVEIGADGSVASIDIGGGRTLSADLYIDCTGFRGIIAEKALGDPWIDWNDQLLNNRAVVMPVPRADDVPPYTHSTAIPAGGWIWQIPLATRTGVGYVHSSEHVSPEEAEKTLIERTSLRRARSADPRMLKMRIGRRTQFWNRNCVAIGLAGGFVEPLESTGIYIIQHGIELLYEYIPDLSFNPALPAAYNRGMAEVMDEIRDFIILHYLVTRREGAFWRDARAVRLPDTLERLLALYDETGHIEPASANVFADTNYYFILAGGGRLPRRYHPRVDLAPPDELRALFARIDSQNEAFAAQMPRHVDLVDAIHPRPA